jgi:hypothetical protein
MSEQLGGHGWELLRRDYVAAPAIPVKPARRPCGSPTPRAFPEPARTVDSAGVRNHTDLADRYPA